MARRRRWSRTRALVTVRSSFQLEEVLVARVEEAGVLAVELDDDDALLAVGVRRQLTVLGDERDHLAAERLLGAVGRRLGDLLIECLGDLGDHLGIAGVERPDAEVLLELLQAVGLARATGTSRVIEDVRDALVGA